MPSLETRALTFTPISVGRSGLFFTLFKVSEKEAHETKQKKDKHQKWISKPEQQLVESCERATIKHEDKERNKCHYESENANNIPLSRFLQNFIPLPYFLRLTMIYKSIMNFKYFCASKLTFKYEFASGSALKNRGSSRVLRICW